MSENRDNGGPAFPVEVDSTQPNERQTGNTVFQTYGMSLRDYFAAKAMQGYLANAWQAQQLDETGDSSREQMATVAEISYVMADAMLEARK